MNLNHTPLSKHHAEGSLTDMVGPAPVRLPRISTDLPSPALDPFRAQIEERLTLGATWMAERLQTIDERCDDITISVAQSWHWMIPDIGIVGYAPTKDTAYIYIEPVRWYTARYQAEPQSEKARQAEDPATWDPKDLAAFRHHLEHDLPATLVHELHHCIRHRRGGYGETLRQQMISEGLAVHTESELRFNLKGLSQVWGLESYSREHRDALPPWGKLFTPEESRDLYRRLNELMDRQVDADRAWFMGSRAANIPRNAAYRLGLERVIATLAPTKRSAVEAVHDDAAAFFAPP